MGEKANGHKNNLSAGTGFTKELSGGLWEQKGGTR